MSSSLLPTSTRPVRPPRFRLPQTVVPVMFSERAYLLITLAISIGFGLISLPTGMLPHHHATLGEGGLLFLNALSMFELQFGLHFLLRYHPSAAQRWLARQPLWTDRGLRSVLVALLVTTYGLLRYYFDDYLHIRLDKTPLPLALVLAQVSTIVGLACQLGIELVERGRDLTLEVEALKREQLQARYESLKQQLSPHFLFNSLSTLTGLIHDEPAAAELFVEEMAQVYRYLLRHGEQAAVPLRDELSFVRSYAYLLRMRFAEGIDLTIDLPAPVLDRPLPPLALQLLVENAVKHNTVSVRRPLHIRIDFDAATNALRVCNTRYPRLAPEGGSGVGLRNLTNRIRLLHQHELLIEQTDHDFCVHVPLPAPYPTSAA